MNVSYKGKILISTPDSSTDIFSRSVVLIIEHDRNGAFGLILNKKNKKISSNISEVFGFKMEIFDGGPVENDKVFFLSKGKPFSEFHLAIDDDHYITEDSDTMIEKIINTQILIEDVKVFSGYSGWSSNQLESEIAKKNWILTNPENLNFLQKDIKNLWKTLMLSLGGEFVLWANTPENISLN